MTLSVYFMGICSLNTVQYLSIFWMIEKVEEKVLTIPAFKLALASGLQCFPTPPS